MPLIGPIEPLLEHLDADTSAAIRAHVKEMDIPYGRPSIDKPLARMLADATAVAPRPAAYCLWVAARNRSDLSEVERTLRGLLDHDDLHVRVYAALALACKLVTGPERTSILSVVRQVDPADRPDISFRNRFASYVWTLQCSWTGRADQPSDEEYNCGACDGTNTTCIHHDGYGDLSGRWEITEMLCSDCGLFTTYECDD